jgi:hypothetical protein
MINNKATEVSEIILLNHKDSFVEFENDEFFLEDVLIEGDILKINVSYNGGCKKHLFSLTAKKNFQKINENTYKVHLNLFHNSNRDNCKKVVTEELFFNLIPLNTEFQKENLIQKNNGLILTIDNKIINYK